MINLPDNAEAYVKSIQNNDVIIVNVGLKLLPSLLRLGAQKREESGQPAWILNAPNEKVLTDMLNACRDLEIAFAGGAAGWPPAEIFDNLRERGLISGKFKELLWVGQGNWKIRRR